MGIAEGSVEDRASLSIKGLGVIRGQELDRQAREKDRLMGGDKKPLEEKRTYQTVVTGPGLILSDPA